MNKSNQPGVPESDDQLASELQDLLDNLSLDEIGSVVDAIIANCSTQFRKVARVVGRVMNLDLFPTKRLPDTLYAQRVYALVESGRLEHEGKLGYMGFCEVRLPER